ncbi:MAG: DUF6438 domain-containing protein [Saprospiraceae bacterium]
MTRLTIAILFLALPGCQAGKNAQSEMPLVELQTGGCYGYCPVVRLAVRHDGWVTYEGKQFAERQGRDSFCLTAEEVKQLRVFVRRANVWQFPDRIESQVVDAPWSTLTVFRDGIAKSVIGSIDRPERLLELENAIKNMAEAHGFQVKQGVKLPDKPK